MARMIPAVGPQDTNSYGEERIYALLKHSLSDEFTVIHSVPWLARGVKEIDPKYAPTGEIDILIVHESLGLLALEVKGGKQRVEDGLFIYVKTGHTANHVLQTRKNAHGLARWLGSDPQLCWRIGYGLVFPDSTFGQNVLSPGLVDSSVTPPQSLVIDRMDMEASEFVARINELMKYWKQTLRNPAFGHTRMARLVEVLCPTFDGTPSWGSRVEYDNRIWLRLTQEQMAVVHAATVQSRMVVTGWPGTGKTLIAVELARRMSAQGKRVLMLTFNTLLVDYLRKEIDFSTAGTVATWHGFCADYARRLRGQHETTSNWLEHSCLDDLKEAQRLGLIPEFDVLILDEAQTFRQEWCAWLTAYFASKPIIAFCDETQRFTFEKERILTESLCKLLEVDTAFSLTIPLRSPRYVLERLLHVRPPAYQLFSPRSVEEGTLQECIVEDMNRATHEVIERLVGEGVDRKSITVLSRYGWLRTASVTVECYETVARFRGMEAPVIIIVGAEGMDDIELFCAYSRATTLCIALYDAESLGCKPSYSKFEELVLKHPDNAKIANDAREQGLTSFILSRYVESTSVGLTSVELSWCEAWKCWFINQKNDLDGAALWIDYLLIYHDWPVYSWTPSSRREMRRHDPVIHVLQENSITETHDLCRCEICTDITPHRRQTRAVSVCQCCVQELGQRETPSQDVLVLLQEFDTIISSTSPGTIAQEERDRLPLPLAALGAHRYACSRGQELKSLPKSSELHRWATAFIYSRISVRPVGTRLERDTLTQETSRYVFPTGVTLDIWRHAIARALGQSAVSGFLKKHKNGQYETLPVDRGS